MNIDEYEKEFVDTYDAFSKAVKCELEAAFETAGENVKRPQAIQSRAKTVKSLRLKLENRNLLASEAIETEIKDLAGVRIIFYTNTDVNYFSGSRLISDRFFVEHKHTKIHYPNPENDDEPYDADHYIVHLTPEILTRSEYSRFKDLRCEIQIQTMLGHVWAEISHEIIYKPEVSGFCNASITAIKKRMRKIVQQYLGPAGHEFDKVLHDFERLRRGKELFDRGMLETLEHSSDNNDRHSTLSTIKEYISSYDDLAAIYPELAQALCNAVNVARQTMPKPIPENFQNLSGYSEGRTAEEITSLAVDILRTLRYFNVEITFHSLAKILRDEADDEVRKDISKAVKQLAGYNIDVWNKCGPGVQCLLTELVEKLPFVDSAPLKQIARIIWCEALGITLEGKSTSLVPDGSGVILTVRRGVVRVSDELKMARRKSINGLIALFDQPGLLAEKKEIVSDLMNAMSEPRVQPEDYHKDLYAMMLSDVEKITDLFAERIDQQPYELLHHIECEIFRTYANQNK
ncbi:RelA/SpoT domain-containing protein [Verminephrobacter aporrectodeae]|uniref:RelA/SpoT domain-containing protein n=1 Tax=Verminephrobacter aporrectodeae TaxID=1110389 RepID=UPI002237593A|nr:RelA/SpoT domain-containing protein [Verminephrobacter aporrectodeae]